MSRYRLELWFYSQEGGPDPALFWGIAKANVDDDVTFSQGGTPIANVNNVVTIPDGSSSSFDIYLIDASSDNVARNLDFIKIDYETAPNFNSSNKDPLADAPGLRAGMTGAQFNGPQTGAAGYTGTTGELTVWSTTSQIVGQRRWSLANGFEGLTDGHYAFTGTVTVSLASNSSSVQTFSFDPEMDIEN